MNKFNEYLFLRAKGMILGIPEKKKISWKRFSFPVNKPDKLLLTF